MHFICYKLRAYLTAPCVLQVINRAGHPPVTPIVTALVLCALYIVLASVVLPFTKGKPHAKAASQICYRKSCANLNGMCQHAALLLKIYQVLFSLMQALLHSTGILCCTKGLTSQCLQEQRMRRSNTRALSWIALFPCQASHARPSTLRHSQERRHITQESCCRLQLQCSRCLCCYRDGKRQAWQQAVRNLAAAILDDIVEDEIINLQHHTQTSACMILMLLQQGAKPKRSDFRFARLLQA